MKYLLIFINICKIFAQDNDQMNKTGTLNDQNVVQKFCDKIQCSQYDIVKEFQKQQCHTCEITQCCLFDVEQKTCQKLYNFPFNYTEIFDLRSKVEVKNISEYPDPMMNVTFPKCNILTETPLYKASNFLYAHHDKCGIPKYCPIQEVFVSSEVKIPFEKGIFQVNQGELCTIYFQGKMGPDFIIHIGSGNQPTQGIKAQMSICLSIGMFDDFPCIDVTTQITLSQTLYYKIRANQFRITLMFTEPNEIDFSQIYFYIISSQKINQYNQQKLFSFIIILLLTILISMVMIGFLKALLVWIFGRSVLDCIDPEPILPRRHQFNCSQEFQKLISQKLVNEVKIEQIKFEQEKCPFCLETFNNQNQIIEIFCGHCFHKECLETHFTTQQKIGKCSICQTDINLPAKRQLEQIKLQIGKEKPLIQFNTKNSDEQELELTSINHDQ